MAKFYAIFIVALLFLMSLTPSVRSQDDNEQCLEWAQDGECTANPGYMLQHCADACNQVKNEEEPLPKSFYEILDHDLDGNEVNFAEFRDKVVYLVNVASHCGYTRENYDMFRKLSKYRGQGLELVLAPCNQFGQQEPGDKVAISNFASKNEFEGIILAKDDVNGPKARGAFRFLKNAAGIPNISWNFDGKFLVSKTGKVFHVASNDDIEDMIKELLSE